MNPLEHLVNQTLTPLKFVPRQTPRKTTTYRQLTANDKAYILQSKDPIDTVCEFLNICESLYFEVFKRQKVSEYRQNKAQRDEKIAAFHGTLAEAAQRFGVSKITVWRIRNHVHDT